jgi:hypothetical protein
MTHLQTHAMRTAVLAGLLVLVSDAGRAQSPFRLDSKLESVLLGSGLLLGGGSLIFYADVHPLSIDEIDRLDVGDINDFDRDGMRPYREEEAGDVLATAAYLFPLAVFARDDSKGDWKTAGAMWVEATLLNQGIMGMAKMLVQRPRPYAYDPDAPLDHKTTKSARLSFYSGHSASASYNCFFTARVLSAYIDGRTAKIALWTGAVLYPVLPAVLRVNSGNHFRTDAITGYLVGAAVGFGVPELHRVPRGKLSIHGLLMDGAVGAGMRVEF